jgi:CTP synthase (UTP-ammonia lyase)
MEHACIALIGDFDPGVTAHRAIEKCFALTTRPPPSPIEPFWLSTESIVPRDNQALAGFGGFWCVPASPYRNTAGALWAIQFAREHNIPFLGTCGGFQHALLEYARNVLRLPQAEHAEINPDAALPLLTRLKCSLVESSQRILVTEPGTFRDAYGADSGEEGFRCNYGLNPAFEHLFKDGPMQIAARSVEGEARGFQLRGHRFFIGTLFQPERRALHGTVHPLVSAFIAACAKGHGDLTEANEQNKVSPRRT